MYTHTRVHAPASYWSNSRRNYVKCMRGTSGEIQPRREGTHFKFLLAVRLRLSLTAAHCSLSTLDSSPVTRTHARTRNSPSLSGICFCSNRRNEKKKKTKENHCKRFLYLKIYNTRGATSWSSSSGRAPPSRPPPPPSPGVPADMHYSKPRFWGGNVDTYRRAVIIIEPSIPCVRPPATGRPSASLCRPAAVHPGEYELK